MNIWCVGRNYLEHAQELKNPIPQEPLLFLKSGDCLVHGNEIQLPTWSQEVHHEIEIAFQFNSEMQFEYAALALDLTERKLQSRLKANGQPWTLAKSFTGSCPMSQAYKLANYGGLEVLEKLEFNLKVNSELRQKARLTEAIFNPTTLSNFVKTHFPAQPGDWLLTGTPAGVAALKAGDELLASWGQIQHQWRVLY